MSATLRYDAVAALSHDLEALLDRLRRGELAPDAGLMNILFAAADLLETSIERAVAGRPDDPRLDDLVGQIRRAALGSPEPATGRAAAVRKPSRAKAASGARRSRAGAGRAARRSTRRPRVSRPGGVDDPAGAAESIVRVYLAATATFRAARAAVAVQRARLLGEVLGVSPALETLPADGPGPEMIEIRLRTQAKTAAIVEQIEGAGDIARVDVRRDRRRGGVRSGRQSGGASHAASGNGGPATDGIARTRHVRIDLRRLDALMDLIGELVIARGRLVALTGAQEESELAEAVTDASRLIGDLQQEIMTCRMVPVWQVFDRFPRFVRDTAQSLGKQVSFEVEGKDIELDRSMLDEIGDPIVHLLRNALDHGIEPPDTRVAAGKPRQGQLRLSAARDRSAVLIRVTDDGRGIDRDKVLVRALESGLVDPGTTALSDDEVIRLIARPGFTTAAEVTDVSGRGVGIDAVQARVRALGGSVDIKSAAGEGTTVTARLPLTLAIVRALLARVGGEAYAFPMAHVDETVSTEGANYAAVRGSPVIVIRGEAIPFVRLRELVGLESSPGASPTADPEQHVIVVELGGHRTAVAVDELMGQADIVVKQFDSVRGGAALFSGATVLGDGAPALIVDVSRLF
jgi:two-component system chemotaxis sensor kinase CheA